MYFSGRSHDNVEAIAILEVVQHLDDVLVFEAVEKGYLFWDHLLANLREGREREGEGGKREKERDGGRGRGGGEGDGG